VLPKRIYNFLQTTERNAEKRSCYYQRHKDLFDYCTIRSKDKRSIQETRMMALNAAIAISKVHNNGYICNDIKPENMLITKNMEILLCDTDSFTMENTNNNRKVSYTYENMAPEYFTDTINDKKMLDVFAFGPTLLWITENGFPNWCLDNRKDKRLTKDLEQKHIELANLGFQYLHNETPISLRCMFLSLIAWTLHPIPEKRPTMEVVCSYLRKTYPEEDTLCTSNPLMTFWHTPFKWQFNTTL